MHYDIYAYKLACFQYLQLVQLACQKHSQSMIGTMRTSQSNIIIKRFEINENNCLLVGQKVL